MEGSPATGWTGTNGSRRAARLRAACALAYPLAWIAVAALAGSGCGRQDAPRAEPSPPVAPGTLAAPEPLPSLRPGPPVERAIEGGGRHLYRLELAAGDFLHLILDQRGVDLAARLIGPDGRLLRQADSPSDDLGPEALQVVATAGGEHRLEVRAFPGPDGRYALTVEALRPATPEDRQRAAAAAAFAAAESLAAAGGDPDAADAALERTGELWRRLGEPTGEAHAHDRRGRLASRRGDPARAAGHHHRAAALFAAAGEPRWQGISLTLEGTARFRQGELRAARPLFEQALALRRAAGDSAGEATLLHNLGHVHQLLGEPGRALDLYQAALAVRRRRGEEAAARNTLHNLGVLERSLGRFDRALDHLRASQAAADQGGDLEHRIASELQIARLYDETGDAEAARRGYAQALASARSRGDRRQIALALSHLGVLARRRRELPAAREHCREALALFQELGDEQAAGEMLTNLGDVARSEGEPAAALELYRRAWPRLAADVAPWSRADNLAGQARAQRSLGDLVAARAAAEAAVELVDPPRERLGGPALVADYSATVQPYFDLWVETLMALARRHPEALWQRRGLAASERARARSFLAAAAGAHLGPPPPAGDGAGGESEGGGDRSTGEALHHRLEALERERRELRRSGRSPALLAAVEGEIRSALDELEQRTRRRRAARPRQAALSELRPLGAGEIQRLLAADELLLEVKLLEGESVLWAVTSERLASHPLPGRRELEEEARRAYELVRRSQRREAAATARQALCRAARTLLAPVAAELAGRRLLVVAEGALLYLPFAALPEPAALAAEDGCATAPPLAAAHAVAQLPSASLLAHLGRERPHPAFQGEVAVLADPVFSRGDPRLAAAGGEAGPVAPSGAGGEPDPPAFQRLPHSRAEAEAVLAQAPAGRGFLATGFDASKQAVLAGRLQGYRALHFATHGVVRPRYPELSGLVLSLFDRTGRPREGFLRAYEIAGLELDAGLVVLSACNSALGREVRGEGLIGLTRSFLAAGADALVVSLWNVDDRSTAELMGRFYRELLVGRRPPAEALARAQAALAAAGPWRAPYHWAGFVYQGPSLTRDRAPLH